MVAAHMVPSSARATIKRCSRFPNTSRFEKRVRESMKRDAALFRFTLDLLHHEERFQFRLRTFVLAEF